MFGLPDNVFNPFDSVFPDNSRLADMALINVLLEQEKKNKDKELKEIEGIIHSNINNIVTMKNY